MALKSYLNAQNSEVSGKGLVKLARYLFGVSLASLSGSLLVQNGLQHMSLESSCSQPLGMMVKL
jgi:hypothetical protein